MAVATCRALALLPQCGNHASARLSRRLHRSDGRAAATPLAIRSDAPGNAAAAMGRGDTCSGATQPAQRCETSRLSLGGGAAAVALAAAAGVLLGAAEPALALAVHPEPANALSLPTWAVHTSSVIEWVTAMGLMWKLAEATGNERWKGMAWGMLPSLGGAMTACTWHFFYNAPELESLVAVQAGLTVVGNFTCWIAAYRLYAGAQQTEEA